MAVQMTKLPYKVGQRVVYVRGASMIRVGANGQDFIPGFLYTKLGRSEARRLRKVLREAGFSNLAAERRI